MRLIDRYKTLLAPLELFVDPQSHLEEYFFYKDFLCIIRFFRYCRCGYVVLPPEYTIPSDDYINDLVVHGGISYSRGAPNSTWILGFDCNHCNDGPDFKSALLYGTYESGLPFSPIPGAVIRTQAFVKEQLIELVDQL